VLRTLAPQDDGSRFYIRQLINKRFPKAAVMMLLALVEHDMAGAAVCSSPISGPTATAVPS
jgi:hypothetical protein